MITRVPLQQAPGPTYKRAIFGLAFVILILLSALIIVAPLVSYGLIVLPILLSLAFFVIVKPLRALYTFILLLPFHSLIITVLLSKGGLSPSLVRLVASWKELLLISTCCIALTLWLSRGTVMRLGFTDLVAATWLLQVIIYFAVQFVFLGSSTPTVALAYGARDWLLFILPYCIGRIVVISTKGLHRICMMITVVGVITALIGIVEVVFIPTEWHIRLGVPTYMRDFLGLSYPTYLGGLPPNYWAEFGSLSLRRAVSVYFSAQGLAVSMLVIFPVVLYRFAFRPTWANSLVLLICSIALILTITRMTVVACYLQALLIFALLGRRWMLALLLLTPLLIVTIMMALSTSFRSFVINTITLSDSSSQVRPARWVAGFAMIRDYPLGMGLGSSGVTGTRFGLGGGGDEAGYFKITGALGLPGLACFLTWFTGIIAASWRVWRSPRSEERPIGLITLAIACGFLVNNLTAPPDQLPFVIYIFAWLAGLVIQLALAPGRARYTV